VKFVAGRAGQGVRRYAAAPTDLSPEDLPPDPPSLEPFESELLDVDELSPELELFPLPFSARLSVR